MTAPVYVKLTEAMTIDEDERLANQLIWRACHPVSTHLPLGAQRQTRQLLAAVGVGPLVILGSNWYFRPEDYAAAASLLLDGAE